MYQIVDVEDGTVHGTYHNLKSAEYALKHDFDSLDIFYIRENPDMI